MAGEFSRESDSRLSLRAEAVNLAGRNISSFEETNIYGPVKQIPEGVTYADDILISFIASQDMFERHFFEEWQQLIYDQSNWNLKYYVDFIGSIDIFLLDRGSRKRGPQRTYGIRCEEAWPKTIGPTELSMTTTNELIKIPVSFAFRYWDRIDTFYELNPTEDFF